MRIGLDARCLVGKMCGVSRVTIEVIRQLALAPPDDDYVVFLNSTPLPFELPANFETVITKCNRMTPLGDLKFAKVVKNYRLDVMQTMHSWLPLFSNIEVPHCVYVYDIFSVTDPEFFAKRGVLSPLFRLYFWWLTKRTTLRAKKIITISHDSRQQIERVYGQMDTPISVVPLASGIEGLDRKDQLDGKTSHRILYVGNFRSYKNIPTLLKGFADLVRRPGLEDCELILAGNDTSELIDGLIAELGIKSSVTQMFRPSDEEIINEYSMASCSVQPSLFEGFGLPVLEAQLCGVPVVTSDAAALIEVGGDSTLVFDRHSATELADKLEALLSDGEMREELIRLGKINASGFSWESTTQLLREALPFPNHK